MRPALALLLAAACFAARAVAQACPADDGSLKPGRPSTFSGTIRYHDGLRPWLGIEVSPRVCGQHELQLTFINGDSSLRYRQTEALAGCHVKVSGSIDWSVTGYYSTNLFIADGKIEPDISCRSSLTTPPSGSAKVPPDLNSYQVHVVLDFANASKPIHGIATRLDGKPRPLTPWEDYVHTWLSGGGDLLWVNCRDGFRPVNASTHLDGKSTMGEPADWLNAQRPGLSAPVKPGPSSITITCVKSSNQATPATSNE